MQDNLKYCCSTFMSFSYSSSLESLCHLCNHKFDVIAKLETSANDTRYILDKIGAHEVKIGSGRLISLSITAVMSIV